MISARVLTLLVALALATPVAEAQEPQPLPSLTQARALYDAGRLDEARRVLQALIRAGSQDPEVFLLAGVMDRTAGHLGRAIDALRQAQSLAPGAAPAAVELATTLAWNRNLARAITLFRQVLAEHPDHAGARSGLGFALAWQGRLDEARKIFSAMAEENPRDVSAWTGLGFVERAYFRRTTAEAAYRRVLEIDPGNADARTALEDLHWDRRGESRVVPGVATNPGVPPKGEGRIDAVYNLDRRVALSGAYQRYAFGAVSVLTGGGVLLGTRTEDSLEGGVVFRPSGRTTLATSLYTFFSKDATRGIVWTEGVYAVTSRVSLIGNVRPAFNTIEPRWLLAWAAGASVSVADQQQLTARALVASNTEFEPRLTVLANYDATLSRRFRVRIGAADSHTDDRFAFTSVTAGATWLVAPSFGLSIDAGRRFETAERSTVLAGIVVRY